MDFLSGIIMGTFAFPVALAALSWWAIIIVVAALIATEAVFYHESHLTAFIILFFVFVFTALVTTEAQGFWASSWAVIDVTFTAMLNYIILGMVATVPLWLWEVRKYYVELRNTLTDFIANKAIQTEKHRDLGNPFTVEEQAICKRYKSGDTIPNFVKEPWKKYRDVSLLVKRPGMKVADNVTTISSMIFLWPFHIITLIFGDFLAKIPEWFAQTFGKVLDYLAHFVRRGIPEDIDAE
jgi:hypothetical protein